MEMGRSEGGMDPVEFWGRWYETGLGMWSQALGGPAGGGPGALPAVPAGPSGLYKQWLETVEDLRESMMGGFATGTNAAGVAPGSAPGAASTETWRKLFDASVESWQRAIGFGQEMVGTTPRYFEMLQKAWENLQGSQGVPKDPLEFAVQWYNATSGPFGEFVQDIIEREEVLEISSRLLRGYAGAYKVAARNSEEYLKALQMPTRTDVTRVAGLVVALEDKVDRIEEAFEDLADGRIGGAQAAPAEQNGEIEERLARVEEKLDRLLSSAENGSGNGTAAGASSGDSGEADTDAGAGADAGARATDAARRKARELGVDLGGVQGTGNGGQITVEDVRRKGATQ